MTEESIIQFLQKNADYFRTNDFILSALRSIGWAITKGLNYLAKACQDLYDISFGLIDITSFDQITNFIDGYQWVLTLIMTCTLTILGFMFIAGKQKQFSFIYSILIIAFVFVSSQWLFSTLNQGVKYFKDSVESSSPTTASETIISENLTDLIYIDKQYGMENMNPNSNIVHEDLTNEELKALDINEVINYKTDKIASQDAKDILKQKLVYDTDGDYSLGEISSGWGWNSQNDTDLGNQFYYRYTFNYGIAWISLAALIIVFICLAYKAIRIIYELLTSRILLPFMASDMTSTQKVIKVLTSIRDGYIALCFTAITLKTYSFFTSYLNSLTSVSGIQLNGFTKAILTLFIAFCVIDGANVMQKLTGVDAGLNGAVGKMITAYHLAKGAGNMVAAPFRAAANHNMRSNIKQQREALSEMKNGGDSNNNHTDQMNQETSDKSNHEDGSDINGFGANGSNMNGSAANKSEGGMDNASTDATKDTGESTGNMNMADSNMSGNDGNNPYDSAEANMKQMDQDINDNGNAHNHTMDKLERNGGMSSQGGQSRTDMEGRTGADQQMPGSGSRMLNRADRSAPTDTAMSDKTNIKELDD